MCHLYLENSMGHVCAPHTHMTSHVVFCAAPIITKKFTPETKERIQFFGAQILCNSFSSMEIGLSCDNIMAAKLKSVS